MSAIKTAIFIVESIAHLQSKEKELLPIVDAARAEHEELVTALQSAVDSFIPKAMFGTEWVVPDWVPKAKAAIAKATGETV